MMENWAEKPEKDFMLTDQQNILVTGSAGLVGSELVSQLLAAGYKVRALYHYTPLEIIHPNLTAIKSDILDANALADAMVNITHVYHCAAVVSFNPKMKSNLFKINISGTANVVNTCIDAGIKKLVHVSSVSALGRIRHGEMVTEEMNWSEETSNSAYGKSKYLGEMEVWRGIGEGLDAIIVNPTLVLGGNDWTKGSSAIFRSAYNELPWYTEGVSGFVDVRDVARAMIMLMNSELTNQRYIINGDNLPYKKVFSEIAQGFGKKPPHKKVTPSLAGLVWRLEALKSWITGKEALITKETTHTAMAKVYFDNSKLKNHLPGFEYTALSKSILDTCATLVAKNHLS